MEYDTLRIDRRITQAYKQWYEARGSSVLTWRQSISELLIREAGYINMPLPPAPPKRGPGRPPTQSTQSPVPQAISAPPVPVPVTFAHPWEDPDWRPDGWVVLPFEQWIESNIGKQIQEALDSVAKYRKDHGLAPDPTTMHDTYNQHYSDKLMMARATAREAWESEQEEQRHAA